MHLPPFCYSIVHKKGYSNLEKICLSIGLHAQLNCANPGTIYFDGIYQQLVYVEVASYLTS